MIRSTSILAAFCFSSIAAAQVAPTQEITSAEPIANTDEQEGQPDEATILAEGNSPVENNDIVVTGSRKSFELNARALRAARAEYISQKEQYAPNAPLVFLITRKDGRAFSTAEIRLQFTNGSDTIPVDIQSDNTFSIDSLPDGDWRVISNVSRRNFWIVPLILSPGSNRTNHRLGDSRLQCRVIWAMAKASASLLLAPIIGVVSAAGPCTGRRIGIYVAAPGTIQAASVNEDARNAPIKIGQMRFTYRLPGEDQTFSNEARVELTIN